MKSRNITLGLTLLGLVLLAACGKQSAEPVMQEKKQLAKAIFHSLKTNSFDSYQQRFSNQEDVRYHFHNIVAYRTRLSKNKANHEKIKQHFAQLLNKFPARRKKRIAALRKEFADIRQRLESHKVVWSDLKLTGIHIEKARSSYNIPTADIILNLSDQNHIFVLRAPLCIKVKRGWIFTEGLRWEGVNKLTQHKKTHNVSHKQ